MPSSPKSRARRASGWKTVRSCGSITSSANGHPYTAVGQFLIERGIVPKEEMTMQRIRQWMDANPEEGKTLRRQNKTVVFFRDGPRAIAEPAGCAGRCAHARPLYRRRQKAACLWHTIFPRRRAADRERKARHNSPADDRAGPAGQSSARARADIYFGAGADAEVVAGRLRHNGRFVMLVPKEIDPVARADRAIPPDTPPKRTPQRVRRSAERRRRNLSLNGAAVPLPKRRPP